VSWRFSGAVVGWAPLLPGFSVYMNVFPDYYASYYTFVPFRRFVGVSVHSVAYAPRYGGRIFRDTRPAPPRAVFRPGVVAPAWGGPARHYAEQRVGRPIAPARIVPVSSPDRVRPVQGRGEIPVYRPGGYAGTGPARPQWARPRGSGGASFPGQRPGMAPVPGGQRTGPGRVPGNSDWKLKKKVGPSPQPSGGYRDGPRGGGGGQLPARPHGGTFAPNRGGGFASHAGSSQGFGKLSVRRIRH
jgi:hypothetical protein